MTNRVLRFQLFDGVLVTGDEVPGCGRHAGIVSADSLTLALRESTDNPNTMAPAGWRGKDGK